MDFEMVNIRAWKSIGAVAAAAVVIAAVIVILVKAYTPTTTAYAINDTAETVTLDYCADTNIVLTPGEKGEITPFAEGSHAYCNVFKGTGDLGRKVGCLYMPLSHDRVKAGTVVHVSTMRPLTGKTSCR